jgi:hypothetical protein
MLQYLPALIKILEFSEKILFYRLLKKVQIQGARNFEE